MRFIVTSLQGRGKTLYEKVFCARGNAEILRHRNVDALDAWSADATASHMASFANGKGSDTCRLMRSFVCNSGSFSGER